MFAKCVDSCNRTVSYMLHSFKGECFLQYPASFRKSSGPHVNATAKGGILKL